MSDNKLFYDIIGWHKFSGKSTFTVFKVNDTEFVIATRKQFEHLIHKRADEKLGYDSNYEADTTSIVIFWETSQSYLWESYRMHNNGYNLTTQERNKRIVNWLQHQLEEIGVEFYDSRQNAVCAILSVIDKNNVISFPFASVIANLD